MEFWLRYGRKYNNKIGLCSIKVAYKLSSLNFVFHLVDFIHLRLEYGNYLGRTIGYIGEANSIAFEFSGPKRNAVPDKECVTVH
jgi:hypothetical protein